jgi:prepilin-type N-terminal cleavage/methylation domain-containing protein
MYKQGGTMKSLRVRKGFTLIEILVVIVIIGILATMGIGKYAQFSRDARKSGCQSNQNTIDKAIGMWEGKYMAITTSSNTDATIDFNMKGDKVATGGPLPNRLKSMNGAFKSEIFNLINDEVIFICPETATAYNGLENIVDADKTSKKDYRWMFWGKSNTTRKHTNNKRRGVGCLVWGTVAQSGDSDRGTGDLQVPGGDGTTGPSGTTEDFHSGVL